jgi:hypothetical protein
MPVTYQIDPARKLIHTRCIGDVNPEEVAAHFRELARDPNLPDKLNVLLDLTEETSLPETKDLREVGSHLREVVHRVRFGACAIVACNDALFGMMRVFEVFAREYFVVTQVFRALAEAEVWLELRASESGV